LRNEWVISGLGTPVIVKTPKIKAPSHTTVGAIHAFSVIHVAIKKSLQRKEKLQIKEMVAT
jgi:hypothetical protein